MEAVSFHPVMAERSGAKNQADPNEQPSNGADELPASQEVSSPASQTRPGSRAAQWKHMSLRELIVELSSLQIALLQCHERELSHPPELSESGHTEQSNLPVTRDESSVLDVPGQVPMPMFPIHQKRFKTVDSASSRVARASVSLEEAAVMSGEEDPDSFHIRKCYEVQDDQVLTLKRKKRAGSSESLKTADWKEEDNEDQDQTSCYIHPSSTSRLVWDVFAMILLLYDLIMIPMQVLPLPDSDALKAWGVVIAVYWSMDILAATFTGVYVHGRLMANRAAIIKHYACTWMLFDITVVTADWFSIAVVTESNTDSVGLARTLRSGRIMRLLRFMRLLRLLKLKRVLDDLQARVNSAFILFSLNVVQLFLSTALLAHVLACIWYAVGDSEDGWVRAEGLTDLPLGETYMKSFQWALSRLHPSTMRDNMRLKTNAERLWALAASFGALLFASTFISMVTNTMAKLQRMRKEKNLKLEAVSSYCASHGIRATVAVKMKKYIDREDEQRRYMQSQALLQDALPPAMLRMLFHSSRSPALCVHDFFSELRQKHPAAEADLCFHALTELRCMQGDTIFGTGDLGNRMYMVCSGRLAYQHGRASLRGSSGASVVPTSGTAGFSQLLAFLKGSNQTQSLAPGRNTKLIDHGDWLSEAALWVSVWHHAGQLVATSNCQLLAVCADALGKILQQDGSALAEAIMYARYFVEELNAMPICSDLAVDPDTLEASAACSSSTSLT